MRSQTHSKHNCLLTGWAATKGSRHSNKYEHKPCLSHSYSSGTLNIVLRVLFFKIWKWGKPPKARVTPSAPNSCYIPPNPGREETEVVDLDAAVGVQIEAQEDLLAGQLRRQALQGLLGADAPQLAACLQVPLWDSFLTTKRDSQKAHTHSLGP